MKRAWRERSLIEVNESTYILACPGNQLPFSSPLLSLVREVSGDVRRGHDPVMHLGKAERIRLFGKVVNVEPVDQDRYGRTVAWASVDGQSLNKELLRAGLAWWYRKYAPDDADLAALEEEARAAQRGLWSMPNPVPPWEFRRRRR